MELLDCYEKLCSCCESSISTNKFYAFSAKTEENIDNLQEQIDNLEISGVTYSAGTNIDITDHVISVTGIDTSTFASKEDLNELSGKVDTISGDVITISGDVITISGDVITISGNTDNKQDKLTEGAFIDIDNSNVISAKIIILTQAQWAALVDKDPTVLYLIREN